MTDLEFNNHRANASFLSSRSSSVKTDGVVDGVERIVVDGGSSGDGRSGSGRPDRRTVVSLEIDFSVRNRDLRVFDGSV